MVLDKRQKILLISFFVIILIIICLLFWNYSGETIKISKPGFLDQPRLGQPIPVDFSVFDNPRLKELKDSGSVIDIGPIGRQNPFEPY